MFAHFQQRNGAGVVVVGRNSHAERFALLCQFPPVIIDFEAEFFTDTPGGFSVDIEDADDFGVGILGVKSGVMATEGADADDSDLQFRHVRHIDILRHFFIEKNCCSTIYTLFARKNSTGTIFFLANIT